MPALLLAFIATTIAALGNKDQMIVGDMSDKLGRSSALLAAAWACSALTAVLMSWSGSMLAAIMPSNGKLMLIAFALGISAFELAWPVRYKPMKEPTRSLGAVFIVLIARQIGDAPRFLIFALAVGMGAPTMAAIGGAIGGGLALTLAWLLGRHEMMGWPLRKIRLSLALIIGMAAIYTGLSARAII